MSKKEDGMIFDHAAREKLSKGIHQFTVEYTKNYGRPDLKKPSRCNNMHLSDPFENVGVQIASSFVKKLHKKYGDGTKTALLLLDSLVSSSLRALCKNPDPSLVQIGMEKAKKSVCQYLQKHAQRIEKKQSLELIATAASGGHVQIGKEVAITLDKVGSNGAVYYEEGPHIQSAIEITNGMSFEKGYLSPYFCTDVEKQVITLEQPLVLVTEKGISSIYEILPLIQSIATAKQELLIFAEDVDKDVLSTLVMNKLHLDLKIAVVKIPTGQSLPELTDIARFTGAKLIIKSNDQLSQVTADKLGRAKKAIISDSNTVLSIYDKNKRNTTKHIAHLEQETVKAKNKSKKHTIEQRITTLNGSLAIIQVGQKNQSIPNWQVHYQKAIDTTLAALQQGVVAGSGTSYIKALECIKKLKLPKVEQQGADLIIEALRSPLLHLCKCSGFDPESVEKEIKKNNSNKGLNTTTEKLEDLFKQGIVEPVDHLGHYLNDALRLAISLFESQVILTEAPEENL